MFDVVHQWIRLNELYNLMESNFSYFEFVSNLRPKTKILAKIENYSKEAWILIEIAMCYISMYLSQQALQANGKFFQIF